MDYPILRFYRGISYLVAAAILVLGVVLSLGTSAFLLGAVGSLLAAATYIVVGDLIGLLFEIRDRGFAQSLYTPAASTDKVLNEIRDEIRKLKSTALGTSASEPAGAHMPTPASIASRAAVRKSTLPGKGVPVMVSAPRFDLRVGSDFLAYETPAGFRVPLMQGSEAKLIGRLENNTWYLVSIEPIGELWIEAVALQLPEDMSEINALPVVAP